MMKIKYVILVLSPLMVSTLSSQPCSFATLQHLWKTAFFKYIAVQKAWQHWRSWQTCLCTSTQVSEGQHKRTKRTRQGIPTAQHMKISFAHDRPTNHHHSLSSLYSSLMVLILDLVARLHLGLKFCFTNKRKGNNELSSRVSLIYYQAKCDFNGETSKSHTWYILLKLLWF